LMKTPTISGDPETFTKPPANESLEQSMVAAHRDSLRLTDVTGVGLNPDEMVASRSASAPYDYSEVDLGSL
jgi:hypothetical protein